MARRRAVSLGVLALFASVYLGNASWLAAPPAGRPVLIAQRGVHQLVDVRTAGSAGCIARHILPPRHRFIENTLPAIRAAINAGADIVEVDARETADGEFVLFHDARLECRTNGTGPINRVRFADLQHLDVGYGYSADGGSTFPLRGSVQGLMTTLDRALRAFPRQRFLVQLKDGAAAGTDLVLYIDKRQPDAWKRIELFGDTPATTAVTALRPDVPVIHDRRASRCTLAYLAIGWSGQLPGACRGGTLVIPVRLRHLAWGWPNRLLARTKASGAQVMMIGSISGLSSTAFERFDDPADLAALPAGFDGLIWTDRIETVGPAAIRAWPR